MARIEAEDCSAFSDQEAAEDGEVPNDAESLQQETSEGLVEEEDATDERPTSQERMDVT